MSDTPMSDTPLGFPAAAHHLGVSVRVLRQAIRAGKLAAPAGLTATATLPAGWLDSAKAAAEASPKLFTASAKQRVPAFARYEGTSAWRKYRSRVREFNAHSAAE